MTRVSAVVLAYLDEPWLEQCVKALIASSGVEVEVIVVDNGCTDGAVERVASLDVAVIRAETNSGFTGGCNLGARAASGDILVFINSDAVVKPEALALLAEVTRRPDVGIATASLRLADDPDRLNSAGNPIHFLGVTWSGSFGEQASAHTEEKEVTGASGAAMAIRSETFQRLGGFEELYFAYHEDAELSVRCWQQGLSVTFVPSAVVLHHYEFSRNPEKFYLIERNRLMFVFTIFETRTLWLIAPALLVYEIAVVILSLLQGWSHQKLAGWVWLVRNRRWIRNRRAVVQESRRVSDRALSNRFAGRLSAGNLPLPRYLYPFDRALELYWLLIRRAL